MGTRILASIVVGSLLVASAVVSGAWTNGENVVTAGTPPDALGNESFATAAISPDGKTIAIGVGHANDMASDVRLWDVIADKALATLPAHTEPIDRLVFSPDGKTLASAAERHLKLWDIATTTERASLKGHTDPVTAIVFSPDSKMVATVAVGRSTETILWDVTSGKALATYAGVGGPRFSRDSKTICVNGFGNIAAYDTASGKELAALKRGPGDLEGGVLSEDGNILLRPGLIGQDPHPSMRVFDCYRGELANTLPGIKRISLSSRDAVFAPDGRTMALLERSTTQLWDVTVPNGKLLATLDDTGHAAHFSPSGDTLAVSGETALTLWDVKTHQQLASLKGIVSFERDGHTNWAFSSDGKLLAFTGQDRTVGEDPVVLVQEARTGKTLLSVTCDPRSPQPRKSTYIDFVLSHDGRMIAVVRRYAVDLFDLSKLPAP